MAADDALYNALEPLLNRSIPWTLHFPMYVNTYCLAHHLASGLKRLGLGAEAIDRHFVSDDWWRGCPTFMYRTDIEIFVAVDLVLKRLGALGHSVPEKVAFTRYRQEWVFTRDNRASAAGKPILVTDTEPTVDILKSSWGKSPPSWLASYGVGDVKDLEVCTAWSRSIGTFFEERKKIYVFGAPMTQIMYSQSIASPEYTCQKASISPIKTYFAFRCNAGVRDADLRTLSSALANYFQELFSKPDPVLASGYSLPRNYARFAMSSGQPNPFPEVYPASGAAQPRKTSRGRDLPQRYYDILKRHHA